MHFRNIDGGFLNFREPFIDNGSVDMLKAMRVYKEVGYDGMMIPDHVPRVEGIAKGYASYSRRTGVTGGFWRSRPGGEFRIEHGCKKAGRAP